MPTLNAVATSVEASWAPTRASAEERSARGLARARPPPATAPIAATLAQQEACHQARRREGSRAYDPIPHRERAAQGMAPHVLAAVPVQVLQIMGHLRHERLERRGRGVAPIGADLAPQRVRDVDAVLHLDAVHFPLGLTRTPYLTPQGDCHLATTTRFAKNILRPPAPSPDYMGQAWTRLGKVVRSATKTIRKTSEPHFTKFAYWLRSSLEQRWKAMGKRAWRHRRF